MGEPNRRASEARGVVAATHGSAGLAILSPVQAVRFTPFERLSVLRKFGAMGSPLVSQSLA